MMLGGLYAGLEDANQLIAFRKQESHLAIIQFKVQRPSALA